MIRKKNVRENHSKIKYNDNFVIMKVFSILIPCANTYNICFYINSMNCVCDVENT